MEIFSEKEFIDSILKNLNGADKKLGHANIIIAGKTGVGKSTLINSVFNEKIAEMGIGKPVTDHLKEYTKSDMPITLYDTVGLELSSERLTEAQKEMLDLIMEKQKAAILIPWQKKLSQSITRSILKILFQFVLI